MRRYAVLAVILAGSLVSGCLSEQEATRLQAEGAAASAQVERIAGKVAEVETQVEAVLAAVKAGTVPATEAAALLDSLAGLRADYESERVEAAQRVDAVKEQLKGKPWYEQLEGLWYVIGAIVGNTALSRVRRGVSLVTGKPRAKAA